MAKELPAPYWSSRDGRHVIYCGDCLEILPALEAGSVDAVVVDPPYGISHQTNHGATWAGNEIAGDGDTCVRDEIVEWAEAGNLPWAVFGSWKRSQPIPTRTVLVWDKGPAFGMGDLSLPWKPSWEEIYIGGKGWSGSRDEGVLRDHLTVSWESKGRAHQHQKPVSLIATILEKLPCAPTVLDPCLGSGTTGVACVRTGRRFIGIELEQKYCDIAVKRMEQELARPMLPFPEPEPAPVQQPLFDTTTGD